VGGEVGDFQRLEDIAGKPGGQDGAWREFIKILLGSYGLVELELHSRLKGKVVQVTTSPGRA